MGDTTTRTLSFADTEAEGKERVFFRVEKN
jgi:hypothetical protein